MAAGEGAKPGFQGRLNLPEGTGEPWRALEEGRGWVRSKCGKALQIDSRGRDWRLGRLRHKLGHGNRGGMRHSKGTELAGLLVDQP